MRSRFSLLLAMLLSVSMLSAQTVPSGFNDAVAYSSSFVQPVGFTFDANGRMYVWEKSGKVWIVDNGVRLPAPLIDLSEEVGDWRDHGCLGFALDPNFLTNGRIYLLYTVDRNYLMNFGKPGYVPTANTYYQATIMRVTRYTAIGPDFNSVDPTSRLVLLGETKQTGVPLLFESHSTGSLVFGSDGTLMLTVGDGASYNSADVGSDPQTYFTQALADSIIRPDENVGALRSQMLSSLNGKMLRLDPETGNGVPSNPFYNAAEPRSAQSRVWALGLRNPYRFCRRPGTGSTDPAAGDPGVFYIGDVGWSTYEELNVCYTAGMNFGWPLFEGMNASASYPAALTPNVNAPNPLYGQGQCLQPNFNFQDLIVQETLSHPAGLPNPCDPSTLIPPNIHTFLHSRPVIDWIHGTGSRCSAFLGDSAVNYNLNDPLSPVPGPWFGGNAAVGGTFITGTGWPAGYQNCYFQADYGQAWIRRVTMTADNKAVQMYDFGSNMGAVVFLKEGPDGALWYIRYETGQIRKISPLGISNLPPVAVAHQDTVYGAGPLTVHFTGSASTDPENGPLSYLWDFGDGTTGTAADTAHEFTAPAGVPTTYTVTLTVYDDQGQPNSTTLIVSVNNTPPNVQITSFPNGQLYPVGVDTTVDLEALVTDAEQGPAGLTYSWQSILHHNNHVHAEPYDHAVESSIVLSGLGCYEETYFYEEKLTVTDAGGLSTTVSQFLYPNCSAIAPTAVIVASAIFGQSPLDVTLDGSASVDNDSIVSYFWDFGDGTFSSDATVPKTFTSTGEHLVKLTVTDNDGLTSMITRVITVYTLDPPQCVGAAGTVLLEHWLNIPGSTVATLLTAPGYPNSPSDSSHPTTTLGPVDYSNNYGSRMRGYIIPTVSGAYTFDVNSDDASTLYLSPSADPAFRQAICSVPGWTNVGEYHKYPSQQSDTVHLQAGVYYYFDLLHKEGGGGDHMTLTWTTPTDTELEVIDATHLASWQDCPPNVQVRMILAGPYDATTGLMHDDLRTNGLLPHTEPYTALGYPDVEVDGTVPDTTWTIAGQNAVVDWVLVELRDASDPTVVVARRAALLQRDGDVMGADGYNHLLFNVPAGQYYVAVRHRNHLAAMTATSVMVNASTAAIDFSSPTTATYGVGARDTLSFGRSGLWAGNATTDGVIKYTGTANDRDAILSRTGGGDPTATVAGYFSEDVNMDGTVKYTGTNNDRDAIVVTLGGLSPNAVRNEQLP